MTEWFGPRWLTWQVREIECFFGRLERMPACSRGVLMLFVLGSFLTFLSLSL